MAQCRRYEMYSQLTGEPVGSFYLKVEGSEIYFLLRGGVNIRDVATTPEEMKDVEEFYQLLKQEISNRDRLSQLVEKIGR